MNEVWMIDYLNAVFPHWGVFPSEELAWEWVEAYRGERPRTFFKPFSITVNKFMEQHVKTTSPFNSYKNQR